MDYNVLVMAMSTLPGSVLDTDAPKVTIYKYNHDGIIDDRSYYGIGQLEVVPLYLERNFGHRITHVIVLCTPETLGPITYRDANKVFHDSVETYEKVLALYRDDLDLTEAGARHKLEDAPGMSHLEFFERRMWLEGIHAEFEPIECDPIRPEAALEQLQNRIRELYGMHKATAGEWHLWLDTHGSFRDISMAMFGLMQMLAAPDEQDFAKYMEGDAAVSQAIKRMGDSRDTVPITAVYTVAFDSANKIQAILDKTEFYRTFTIPAITAYMNYGQYTQMLLKPDTSGPYAFVSYRRDDAPLERRAFLGSLRRYGYRYWYDDGIELQEEWEKKLHDFIYNSACFIGVVTKTYYTSGPCVRELRQAIDENKLVILVSPDNTPLYSADKDIEAGGVVIRREELAAIVKHQQFNMSTHIINDVFQEPAVEARLKWLCDNDERFARIRQDAYTALPTSKKSPLPLNGSD